MSSTNCKEKDRIRSRERYWKLREQGLCTKCTAPVPVYGDSKCALCQRKQNYYSRNHYNANKEVYLKRFKKNRDKWKKEGRCSACGGPTMDGKTKCVNCICKLYIPRREKSYATAYQTITKRP